MSMAVIVLYVCLKLGEENRRMHQALEKDDAGCGSRPFDTPSAEYVIDNKRQQTSFVSSHSPYRQCSPSLPSPNPTP